MKVWDKTKQVRLPLFDQATENAFRAYHANNPQIYEQFVVFTFQAINAGRKHLGAKMIAERMRFESLVSGDDGFKINNSYIAFYARMFERNYPQHKGLFEFRKSRADDLVGV